MNYKKLYFHLFNRFTDVLEAMNDGDIFCAKNLLLTAQQETEEMYMSEEEEPVVLTLLENRSE